MRGNELDKAMSNCLKHNIKVYPVHISGKWYVEVNNNGTIKTYLQKSIGAGNKLHHKQKEKGDDWSVAISKTWLHWSNLIDKNKE